MAGERYGVTAGNEGFSLFLCDLWCLCWGGKESTLLVSGKLPPIVCLWPLGWEGSLNRFKMSIAT